VHEIVIGEQEVFGIGFGEYVVILIEINVTEFLWCGARFYTAAFTDRAGARVSVAISVHISCLDEADLRTVALHQRGRSLPPLRR
jgi:hypothetical protein